MMISFQVVPGWAGGEFVGFDHQLCSDRCITHMPVDFGRQLNYAVFTTYFLNTGRNAVPGGRPRAFDRDKALQDAMMVFWRNGYHASSIPDLCEGMGIKVTSLYAAFGNKENLYIEAIGLYMKATQKVLWAHLEKGDSARLGLRNMFSALVDVMTDSASHPVGCWTTLALVDEDMPTLVVRAIRKARSDWLDVMHAYLAAAANKGELPASANLDGLTRFYVAIVQGIGVQAHDGATRAELNDLAETAMTAWPGEAA